MVDKLLVVFDVEGVLVDGEFLPELAQIISKKNDVEALTLKGIRGQIPWEEGLLKRVNLLKGIDRTDAITVANNLKLMKNAKKTLRWIKKRGITTVGISGGFYIVLNRVKRELGLDYAFANELIFNEDKLSGVKINVTSDKTKNLVTLMSDLGEKQEDLIAIVDGANDVDLLKLANYKIAFNAQSIVKHDADVVIETKDLLRIIPPLEDILAREGRR